jgi:hypothetical protein
MLDMVWRGAYTRELTSGPQNCINIHSLLLRMFFFALVLTRNSVQMVYDEQLWQQLHLISVPRSLCHYVQFQLSFCHMAVSLLAFGWK